MSTEPRARIDADARQPENELTASGATTPFPLSDPSTKEIDLLTAQLAPAGENLPKVAAHPKTDVRAESKLRFRTGAEIAVEEVAATEWIVKPWIAAGSITEVAGKVKIAGKTTWVTHLVRAVLNGLPFMGEPTVKGPVVYLTEQNPSTFRVAMERADLLGREDFVVLFWIDTFGMNWRDVVIEAGRECQRRGAKLLVVDTIAQFAHLPGDAENNAGDALGAMRPLQAIANAGIGVLVVRHERKSGGEVGDSGRGSSAFAGAVDTVLSLRRPEGNHPPALRQIQAISRFSETPSELVIELTPEGYVVRGTTPDVAEQKALGALVAVTPRSKAEAVTIDQLIERTSGTRSTVQRAIDDLLADMRLARTGEGKRGDPYRYYVPSRAQTLSAQTSFLDGRQETAQGHSTDSAQTPTHDEQNGQKESVPPTLAATQTEQEQRGPRAKAPEPGQLPPRWTTCLAHGKGERKPDGSWRCVTCAAEGLFWGRRSPEEPIDQLELPPDSG